MFLITFLVEFWLELTEGETYVRFGGCKWGKQSLLTDNCNGQKGSAQWVPAFCSFVLYSTCFLEGYACWPTAATDPDRTLNYGRQINRGHGFLSRSCLLIILFWWFNRFGLLDFPENWLVHNVSTSDELVIFSNVPIAFPDVQPVYTLALRLCK